MDGGYIENGVYYFFITDHLGSNRVVANTSGTAIQNTHYYPFGTAFGESAGQEKQPYKYNGKKLDLTHGLNLYDYSARYMDSPIGRFTSVDPKAEKYYSWSPYAYVANNPIKYIDPTGKILRIANQPVIAAESIARIAATTYGANIVNDLISKPSIFGLTAKTFFNQSEYVDDITNIRYVGNPWKSRIDGGSLTAMIAMGHEMIHASDHANLYFRDRRDLESNPELNKFVEGRAVSFANYLREVYDLYPLRENYSGLGVRTGSSMFHQLSSQGEKVMSFTSLGNNESKSSFGYTYSKPYSYDLKIGNKTFKIAGSTQYYMVVNLDKDKNVTYNIYNNEEEYREATKSW